MAKSEDGKPRVVWQLSNDGLQPSKTPYGFTGRNPVQVVIPPGQRRQVSLQVQANVPLLAFPARSHADDVTVDQIIQPGQDIVAFIENKSQHVSMVIDDKEGLVSLYPLLSDAVGEVG